MTQFLPPNLLALFAARDPIEYLPPADKLPHEKKRDSYNGLTPYIVYFEDPKDTPAPTRTETKDERKERKRKERAEQAAYKLEQDLAMWKPAGAGGVTEDPFKTLFIARINFDTSENKIRRDFESYGPIKSVRLVKDKITGKPKGYAFIEYEHARDMHSAYKHADGKKIDGRRVLVDVERGRTVEDWRPRRLGGGRGGTRRGAPEENTRYSGREEHSEKRRSSSRDRGDRRERDRGDRDRGERDRGERGERPERVERGDRAERERGEERRERRRSRSRERRKRSRSRSKERRRHRSRSRERRRSKERGGEERERKRRRSRSRDRERRRDRDRAEPEEKDVDGPAVKTEVKMEEENGAIAPDEY